MADLSPLFAITPAGADGSVAGVTAGEGFEAAEMPTALVALTVNVYGTPFERLMSEALVLSAETLTEAPPGEAVTVKPVIGEPLSADGVQVTWANLSPRTAVTAVGAVGTAAGVTAADCRDGSEVPFALVAATVKVYGLPFVRPGIEVVVTVPVTVFTAPPGDVVMVYPEIGKPLFDPGVHVTWAVLSPRTAATAVGGAGMAAGVTAVDGSDGLDRKSV